MGKSDHPSTVTMPHRDAPYPSMLDFLAERFPAIDRQTWKDRILSGNVIHEDETAITLETPYMPGKRLRYFREVACEPVIPFQEEILFSGPDLLVACKPHFLPVIPGGPYVNECLLNRLKKRTGNSDLVPINRIDRETAGLVLFSMNRQTRGNYQALFMSRDVEKTYEAVAVCPTAPDRVSWTVENRIVKGRPWFRMATAPGKPNAVSRIRLISRKNHLALFSLSPVTGRKHQLRLHLSGLGFPILNDRFYPELQPERADDFTAPLKLLSRRIEFQDPLSGKPMAFESSRSLEF